MAGTDKRDGGGGTDLLDRKQTKTATKRPRMYKVLLLNDDVSDPDNVVTVLRRVFAMDLGRATHVMMEAHTKGSALCATYTFEVAETKVAEARTASAQLDEDIAFAAEPV